jgi:hypothetical protein
MDLQRVGVYIDRMWRNARVLLGLSCLIATAEASPGKAAREGFVEQFAEFETADLGFTFRLGTPDTTLSVVVAGRGKCNRALLAKIVELAGEPIRNVGFKLVECASERSIRVKP